MTKPPRLRGHAVFVFSDPHPFVNETFCAGGVLITTKLKHLCCYFRFILIIISIEMEFLCKSTVTSFCCIAVVANSFFPFDETIVHVLLMVFCHFGELY